MKASLARPFRSLAIGTAMFLSLASLPVAADHHGAGAPPKDVMPIEEIIAKAKQDKPGRVVEVDLDHEHGRYVYEVEIVDDAGVEWDLTYDARTGKLLSTERDD